MSAIIFLIVVLAAANIEAGASKYSGSLFLLTVKRKKKKQVKMIDEL